MSDREVSGEVVNSKKRVKTKERYVNHGKCQSSTDRGAREGGGKRRKSRRGVNKRRPNWGCTFGKNRTKEKNAKKRGFQYRKEGQTQRNGMWGTKVEWVT